MALSVAVVVTLWVFQTVFLEELYKNIRLRDISRCADVMLESDVDVFGNKADELSEKYNVCISVFRIDKNSGTRVAQSHIDIGCTIHNIDYNTPKGNAVLTHFYQEGKVSDDGYMENAAPLGTGEEVEVGSIIFSKVAKVNETEYMYLFNASVYPLESTVSTMRAMLVVISAVLVLVSLVLSTIVSKKLTSPMEKMSREAHKLALGNYNVRFDGGSYTETCMLADTLNTAAEELGNLDKMQKDLVANVSHDLRTPLTLISGFSEIMRDIPAERTVENMQVIIDETERLTSLVNDILDQSKYMSGNAELAFREFSLTATVENVIKRFSKLCEKENFNFIFEHEGEAVVEADEGAILQVIYNLVNNAVNYSGENKSITIRQIVNDGVCRIEVSDNGEGIPKEKLPLIWDRYYKDGTYHKRGKNGSGIGLSIVKNVLVLHKTSFGVKSKIGVGSTFWFELPIILYGKFNKK